MDVYLARERRGGGEGGRDSSKRDRGVCRNF